MKIWKWIGGLVGLLISASGCLAAFGIFQTALPSRTQVSFSTYGGVCNGQRVTRVTSIASGTANLSVTVATFASGDVGKAIRIPGAGTPGNDLNTTILTFTDSQNVVLAANASQTLSSVSTTFTFGADDTAAFLAFKAAYQGTVPVQLNLPAGGCTWNPGSGNNQFLFKGVGDLVVQGAGKASTSIQNMNSVSYVFMGGDGQQQNNRNSIRTNDAAPGDSCVTLKNSPAVTVSNMANNLAVPATFTASMSGTTMTVTAVASGTIAAGAYVTNRNSDVTSFTQIQPYGTAGTTGVGGTGTYAITISQTRSSGTMTTAPASFTADFGVTNAGLLTVTAVADGTIAPGMFLYRQGGGIGAPKAIMPYGTGGTTGVGGVGTYMLNVPPASNQASAGFIGNGQVRVTLNSTAGLTSGDTLPFTSITGAGQLPFRVSGLQWIKVINGTQVDFFQQDFNGGYTSGGSGGGDQTGLFPVGSKVMMSGWANQAYWASAYSFPSNPNFFEYRTVASVNSTTHQVCFDTPLNKTYKAAWPQFNAGSQFEVDPGGPATLYLLDPSWEMTRVIKDLTIDSGPATESQGRTTTFQDVGMTGGLCIFPSQNETMNWVRVTGSSCIIEVDKMIGTWNTTDSSVLTIDYQSSSIDVSNHTNLTLGGNINGSGKKLNIQGATIAGNLQPGAFGSGQMYGATEETICNNCAVTGNTQGIGGLGMPVANSRIPWSMSGGLITIPMAYNNGDYEIQTKLLPPGAYFVWTGRDGIATTFGRVAKVVSVTSDMDNAYIQTNESGGFPTGTWSSVGLTISSHPAPKFTGSFTGGSTGLTFNGCPAQSPMYSCQNFTYTGGASGASSGLNMSLLGTLDTFTFTNNVPYTNSGSLTWSLAPNGWRTLTAGLAIVSFGGPSSPDGNAIINTKLPSSAGGGTRTLPSGGPATGTQVGDTVTAPTTTNWFGGSSFAGPSFSANTPSDSPQVTVTLRTNQNLPP